MDESPNGAPAAAIVVRQSRLQRDGLGTGAGPAIPLPFFSVREVRRQCLAAGWSFADRR
jgi:hypothetical protein